MLASIQISQTEFKARAARLLEHLQSLGLQGVVLFDPHYILYYTGFAFIPTERPIACLLNAAGERALFVPRLEAEHARANAFFQRVEHYLEYPYTPHPMVAFSRLLAEMGLRDRLGCDTDGYPWILGYRGPTLTELTGTPPTRVAALIEDQMMIKSPAELALIRESVKWGHLAHVLLQRYTHVGATETEVSLRASQEATLAMMDSIGPIYRAQSFFSHGPHAGYRGQIGRNAAIPHALANNLTFKAGDVLVTGAGAPVWGYNSELERTMIIGPATDEQKRLFDHMVALQDAAFAALRPGAKCSDVDRAVRAYYEQHDLMPYWKHHVGHAIGLRYHEGPFLDLGDDTEIKPGMVFTVEPGLYAPGPTVMVGHGRAGTRDDPPPGLGGFRHSDTVVITDDGIEVMTYYPRDLESLTLPI